MTKLKTNKTFIKGSKTKNINKKIKTEIEIPKIDRVNLQCFREEKENKRGKKNPIEDKSPRYYRHTPHHEEEGSTALLATKQNSSFDHVCCSLGSDNYYTIILKINCSL